jgi:sugar transferase (PEP-CTERM/EpsH1 system associated)
MARILYLCHRLPYPPNKGDKVRSYHMLRHLLRQHEVHLASFVDDAEDEPHVATLEGWCAGVMAPRLHRRSAQLASLAGLATGEPLSLPFYRHAGLARWVRGLIESRRVDLALVFSSPMAQYVSGHGIPMVVDLVDVDSAKWADYGRSRRGPMAWLYGREGRTLLDYERRIAAASRRTLLATDMEADLFRSLAPESAGRIGAVHNGVDVAHFDPNLPHPNPFPAGERPIVFTGAMDYWPNVDAVQWFVRDMLPAIAERCPGARFHIVGRSPAPAVQALAGPRVNVTGTVPDVRPYLQHAAAVVAPLRLARGIQNKVLEAMAMARPVVAAAACVEAIDAEPGVHLLSGRTAEDFIAHVCALLEDPARATRLGQAGRERVQAVYDWSARLAALDACLAEVMSAPGAVPRERTASLEVAS